MSGEFFSFFFFFFLRVVLGCGLCGRMNGWMDELFKYGERDRERERESALANEVCVN